MYNCILSKKLINCAIFERKYAFLRGNLRKVALFLTEMNTRAVDMSAVEARARIYQKVGTKVVVSNHM